MAIISAVCKIVDESAILGREVNPSLPRSHALCLATGLGSFITLQVSRDERNEYFGITLERAIAILDALNVRLHTKVEIQPPRELAYA